MAETNKIFDLQELSKKDNKLLYLQILENVLKAKNPKQMQDCVKLYINYVANRRGIGGTYSFTPPKNVIEAEKLADCFPEGETRAYVNLETNHFVFNQLFLTCNNFEDFAFVVQEIEHEFQHMALKMNPNSYSAENPNGIKSEYYNHKAALLFIKSYLENDIKTTKQFSEADLTMLKTVADVLYHFDDNEIYARLVGIEAARKFLNDMEKIAGKQYGSALKKEIKNITQSYLLNEQSRNAMKEGVLKENQAQMHILLYSVLENAIRDNNLPLACAVAETQDIKQLYNPVIYKHLKKFAKRTNSMELKSHLSNSKYAQTVKKPNTYNQTIITANAGNKPAVLSSIDFEPKPKTVVTKAPKDVIVAKELPEEKPKKVFGRRFASEQKIDENEFLNSLKQEIHGNSTLSSDAKGFLERRINRMQHAHKNANDAARDLTE